VREKLRVSDEKSRAQLNRFETMLMQLTKHELNESAEFIDGSSFRLKTNPFPERDEDIQVGLYELPRRTGEAHLYRLNHPLADALLSRAKYRSLEPTEVHLNYAEHEGKISIIEPFVGLSGWLSLSVLTVESLDYAEDHLVFAAVTDMGQTLGDEVARRLLTLSAQVAARVHPPEEVAKALDSISRERGEAVQRRVGERNARFFEAEAEKLEGWADDLKLGLEREIKEIDRQIKEARRAATAALTLDEKLVGQKQIKALEALRSQKRRSLFDAQDDVEARRDKFIRDLENKLNPKITERSVFTIRWLLI
jgi:hypothetical protein